MSTDSDAYTPCDWNDPAWHQREEVHNWRNYVSKEIQEMWPTFNDEQKKALARSFEASAQKEEWE